MRLTKRPVVPAPVAIVGYTADRTQRGSVQLLKIVEEPLGDRLDIEGAENGE